MKKNKFIKKMFLIFIFTFVSGVIYGKNPNFFYSGNSYNCTDADRYETYDLYLEEYSEDRDLHYHNMSINFEMTDNWSDNGYYKLNYDTDPGSVEYFTPQENILRDQSRNILTNAFNSISRVWFNTDWFVVFEPKSEFLVTNPSNKTYNTLTFLGTIKSKHCTKRTIGGNKKKYFYKKDSGETGEWSVREGTCLDVDDYLLCRNIKLHRCGDENVDSSDKGKNFINSDDLDEQCDEGRFNGDANHTVENGKYCTKQCKLEKVPDLGCDLTVSVDGKNYNITQNGDGKNCNNGNCDDNNWYEIDSNSTITANCKKLHLSNGYTSSWLGFQRNGNYFSVPGDYDRSYNIQNNGVVYQNNTGSLHVFCIDSLGGDQESECRAFFHVNSGGTTINNNLSCNNVNSFTFPNYVYLGNPINISWNWNNGENGQYIKFEGDLSHNVNYSNTNWNINNYSYPNGDGSINMSYKICNVDGDCTDTCRNFSVAVYACGDGYFELNEECESSGTPGNIQTPGPGCGDDCMLDTPSCTLTADPSNGNSPLNVDFLGTTNFWVKQNGGFRFHNGMGFVGVDGHINGSNMVYTPNYTYNSEGDYIATMEVRNGYSKINPNIQIQEIPTSRCSTPIHVENTITTGFDIQKDVHDGLFVSGSLITFRIAFANTGNIDSQIDVYDNLPNGVLYLTSTIVTGLELPIDNFLKKDVISLSDKNLGDKISKFEKKINRSKNVVYAKNTNINVNVLGNGMGNKYSSIITGNHYFRYEDVSVGAESWGYVLLTGLILESCNGHQTNTGFLESDIYNVLIEDTSDFVCYTGNILFNKLQSTGTLGVNEFTDSADFRVYPNEFINYRIYFENIGQGPKTINIRDVLATGYFYSGYSWHFNFTINEPNVTVGIDGERQTLESDNFVLPAGQSGYLDITGSIVSGFDIIGNYYCNYVWIDGVYDRVCAQLTGNLPNLWINKSLVDSGKIFTSGDLVGFRIDFGNTGYSSISGVEIEDYFPGDLIYTGSYQIINGGNDATCSYHYDNDGLMKIVCTNIEINSFSSGYILLTGLLTSYSCQEAINLATISGTNLFDTTQFECGAVPYMNKQQKTTGDWTQDDIFVGLGTGISYRLYFANSGGINTTGGVRIYDLLPLGFDYLDSEIHIFSGGADITNSLTINFGSGLNSSGRIFVDYSGFDLGALNTGYVIINGIISSNRNYNIYINSGYVEFSNPIVTGNSNTVIAIRNLDITVDFEKDILDESGNNITSGGFVPDFTSGDVINFQIQLVNSGDMISNIVINDVRPNNNCVSFLGRTGIDFSRSGNNMTWIYNGNLDEGQSAYLYLSGQIISTGDECLGLHANTGVIYYDLSGDNYTGNNDVWFNIRRMGMYIHKTAIMSGVEMGNIVSFKLRFGNDGNTNVNHIVVSDIRPGTLDLITLNGHPYPFTYSLPEGITLSSYSSENITGGQLLEWIFNGTLEPGMSGYILLTGKLVR